MDRTPPDVSPLLANRYPGFPGGVTLTWSPGSGTTSYRIERSLQPDFGVADTFATTSATWSDAKPPAGTIVFYRARGVNACGVLGD